MWAPACVKARRPPCRWGRDERPDQVRSFVSGRSGPERAERAGAAELNRSAFKWLLGLNEIRKSSLTDFRSALTSASLCGGLRLFKGLSYNRRETTRHRWLDRYIVRAQVDAPFSGYSADRSLKTESESNSYVLGSRVVQQNVRLGSIQSAVLETAIREQHEYKREALERLAGAPELSRITSSTV
jgi:hypothetical protein